MSTTPDDPIEPDFAPWDGRRVPVTLLGGYLGAGKTTVINELLARTDRPIAVLVNDVGAVNVDAALIRARCGDTIELTDGCICCSLAGGLADAFDRLRERDSAPDHVVIELSGVADPRRVLPWTSSAGFRLDGVVVLVDADRFLDLEADEVVGGAVRGQLDAADLFLLTKLDLVDGDHEREVRRRLHELAPDTPVVAADPTAAAGLLGLATRRSRSAIATPDPSLFDVHTTDLVPLPRPISEAELDDLLDGLTDDVLRAKGVALAPDGDRLLVQVVGRRRAVTPLPGAEDEPPTDLVVIRRR